MIFQQSLLMQADLEIYSTVVALGWFAVIERFLKALNENSSIVALNSFGKSLRIQIQIVF
jgi:hypothetical protein